MKHLLSVAAALVCTTAAADQFHVAVVIDCRAQDRRLEISVVGAWNERGESLGSNTPNITVLPAKLVKFDLDANSNYAITAATSTRSCAFGSHDYQVEVKPAFAPRFHPEGWCATRIGASVVVRKQGRAVASSVVDGCTESGHLKTGILVRPGRPPVYKTVTASSFYSTQ